MRRASSVQRASAVMVAVGVVVASCTGGGDDGAANDVASFVDEAPSAEVAVVDEGDVSALDDADDVEPFPFSDRTTIAAEVVDPTADERCERLGYACTYAEIEPDLLDETFDLGIELNELANSTDDPIAGLGLALDVIEQRDDLAELMIDALFGTSFVFRIEGSVPTLVATDMISPNELERLDEYVPPAGSPLAVYDAQARVEPEIDLAPLAVPVGVASVPGGAAPWRYQPVGGPIVPKTALVVDGFARDQLDTCPDWVDTEQFGCLGEAPNAPLLGAVAGFGGRTEGVQVASIMAAHPQIEVTYINQIDPWDLAAILPTFDLVHIVGHGSSGCAPAGSAWQMGIKTIGEPLQEWFQNAENDPDRCYSAINLGPMSTYAWAAERESQRMTVLQDEVLSSLPTNVWFHGYDWVVTDLFIAQHLKAESISFVSACTSADGQLGRAIGADRTVVAWHGYARTTVAQLAAITFWDLMVTHGLDTESVMSKLHRRSLDWSLVRAGSPRSDSDEWWTNIAGGFYRAQLAMGGRVQRARDVITTTHIETATDGFVGDDIEQVIPVVRFLVEGVIDGDEAETRIRTLLDGAFLEPDREIMVSDGTIVSEHDGWKVWEVRVEDLRWPFDLSFDDVRPSAPKRWRWEARASLSGGPEYTAHLIEGVEFSGELAADATLSTFDELASQLAAAGGSIEGPQLRLVTRSDGGPVIGRFDAVMSAGGAVVGRWELDLTGEFDAGSAQVRGSLSGFAEGGAAGEFVSGDATGSWSGVLDLETGVLTGLIEISGQLEPFDGRLAGTTDDERPPDPFDDRFDDLDPLPPSDPGALVG